MGSCCRYPHTSRRPNGEIAATAAPTEIALHPSPPHPGTHAAYSTESVVSTRKGRDLIYQSGPGRNRAIMTTCRRRYSANWGTFIRKARPVTYRNRAPLSEFTVQCTLLASRGYIECPAARGVKPNISFEMGHSSRHIPCAFICCMMYGCFVNAKPWPIRFAPRSRASTRFPSVSDPISSVSPQWKRKGMSRPSFAHCFLKSRNSAMKALRGFPLPSSPAKSNPRWFKVNTNRRATLHRDVCVWRSKNAYQLSTVATSS